MPEKLMRTTSIAKKFEPVHTGCHLAQMAKPNSIELPDSRPIRILDEDAQSRMDKPPGWMPCRHFAFQSKEI